jgi:hypothetical protein
MLEKTVPTKRQQRTASANLPPMKMYFDAAPPDDPFYIAIKRSAFWNWWASVFSGLSALCVAIKFFL